MKAIHLFCMSVAPAMLLATALQAPAQDHGGGSGGTGGHGGGGGCGDVFGDLIHILRYVDPSTGRATGQPLLAQRWVELPKAEPGYGWGYCPIAVYTVEGQQHEIPFMPYSCDPDASQLNLIEEVNYFGRLNSGRTKERNHRMHFNEVIANIKAGQHVKRDAAGRLMIGFGCNGAGNLPCTRWTTVDSPMENMALYTRLMKYGHLATDPYEEDTWAKGDPSLPTQFHPALTQVDWPKFHISLRHLLPNAGEAPEACWDFTAAEAYEDTNGNGAWDPAEPFIDIDKDGEFDPSYPRPEPFTDLDSDGVWDAAEPFSDDNGNGVPDAFAFLCAEPESLDAKDFATAAVTVAGAANKNGKFTHDLVQYLNRILKITVATPHTWATQDILPALYRDCWPEAAPPLDPPEGQPAVDPAYLDPEFCDVVEADPLLTPNYELFTDIQETFVDFSALQDRERESDDVEIIVGNETSGWFPASAALVDWLSFVNGPEIDIAGIDGFVSAASDALRAIEFLHNYSIPEDLYCKYDPTSCP